MLIMKKILILTLCFLMCFITLTPTAFAKCSHKNTKWETLQEATCTKAGKKIKDFMDRLIPGLMPEPVPVRVPVRQEDRYNRR